MSPEPPSRTEQLVLLLTQNQEPLFRYIFSLVSSEADARDILQETSLALYRKFDQYENSRPFLPWAYRFAYLQIQKHRTKFARSPLLFSEDLIHLFALEREQMEPELKAGGLVCILNAHPRPARWRNHAGTARAVVSPVFSGDSTDTKLLTGSECAASNVTHAGRSLQRLFRHQSQRPSLWSALGISKPTTSTLQTDRD